jgi:hypothetical protein
MALRLDCEVSAEHASFETPPKCGSSLRTEHAAKQDSRRHCCRRPFVELRDAYFGYLNSGAAFSASLVVFIDATHLLSLFRLTFTEAGETAT